MSPAGTLCFDIFSPPSGDSDVISQVERLSSNEMNIAPRSLRIVFGASGRSATVCMVVSRVGDRNLTLPERRSLSTSPWDLEAEIVALRHQLNVLRRKSPKRPAFSNFDRLIFACLYRISPRIVNALVIVKPETVIRWHGAGFRFFWRWKSRTRGGRPKVPLEIRQLIRKMSLANPPGGAPRIHGELLKLGIDVGQTLGRQVHGKAQETPLSRLQDVIEAIFDPIFEVRTAFVFGVVNRLEEFSVAPGATDAFRGAASGGLDQARIS